MAEEQQASVEVAQEPPQQNVHLDPVGRTVVGSGGGPRLVPAAAAPAADVGRCSEERQRRKAPNKPYHPIRKITLSERNRLLMENLGQVRYIARRIHDRLPPQVDMQDLVHAGVLGLIDALHKYDPGRDIELTTYAKFRIRGSILDSLRKLDWSPRDLRKKARRIDQSHRNIEAQFGRAATDSEVAADMGVSLQEYECMLAELRGLDLGSLEDTGREDSGRPNLDRFLRTSPDQDPFHLCVRSEVRGLLENAIEQLPARERQVLALYYFEELTMKEVGAMLGVNESRVSQIHSAAMVRLRVLLQQLRASLQSLQPAGEPAAAVPEIAWKIR